MYESQASEYKYEIERLARELQEIKKKYFQMKKHEQRQKFVKSWKADGYSFLKMYNIPWSLNAPRGCIHTSSNFFVLQKILSPNPVSHPRNQGLQRPL